MEDINIETGIIVDAEYIRKMQRHCDLLMGIREQDVKWKPVIVRKGEVNPHQRDVSLDVKLPPTDYSHGIKKGDEWWRV